MDITEDPTVTTLVRLKLGEFVPVHDMKDYEGVEV